MIKRRKTHLKIQIIHRIFYLTFLFDLTQRILNEEQENGRNRFHK
jgi:hypothetical protein